MATRVDEVTISLSDIITTMDWVAGVVMLVLFTMFVQDMLQSQHAVRHNFPLAGRLRYFLECQGNFFRQYFFANDRQEMPFNRATHSWVYCTAKVLGYNHRKNS